MKQKILLYLFAVFAAISSTGNLCAQTTYTVNSSGDESTGSGTSGTLRYCIAQAQNGDSIEISSTVGTITLSKGLGIATDITIKGNGTKLVPSGSGFAAIYIAKRDYTVTIEGLWFDGFNNNNGANCPFDGNDGRPNNTFKDWGGAISTGCWGDLTVQSCIFTDNKSGNSGDGRGGAISKGGDDAGHESSAALKVLGCTFIGNTGSVGAAIWVHDRINANTVKIEGNVFYNNFHNDGITLDHFYGTNSDAAIVRYNAYNGNGAEQFRWEEPWTYNKKPITLGAGNIEITENPLDGNFVPTAGAIQVLPDPLPNGYPENDFSGTTINVRGFAGAKQTDPIAGLFGLSLSHTGIRANVGDAEVTLTATPVAIACTPTITWSSNDETVATVNSSTGAINFVGEGTATITATASYVGVPSVSAQATVRVSKLINTDGNYNRSSWTVAANEYGDFYLWDTFADDIEGAWKYDGRFYPMALLDGSLKSGWESGTENPKYIVIDMKQDLPVKSVDISGPLEGRNEDWPAGCLDGYIKIFLTNTVNSSSPTVNYSNYNVRWDEATRLTDYVAWTNSLTLPNLSASVPEEWGNPVANKEGTYMNKVTSPKPDPFVLPDGSHGRYMIIVVEKSGHKDYNWITLGEVTVKSPQPTVYINNTEPGYGSTEASTGNGAYSLNASVAVNLSATTINDDILSVGWNKDGETFSPNATATYTAEQITSDIVFETVYSVNLPTPLNSTGWTIESNAGTEYRGSLADLIDLTKESKDVSNHSYGENNSRVKKYFTIELPDVGLISAVNLFNTDGVTYHEHCANHKNDFAGKRISVYLTNTKPDGNLNIDNSIPAEWGAEKAYMTAPSFTDDGIQDAATVVLPYAAANTPYKYVILVVEHKNDYLEVGGIRLYGKIGHIVSYDDNAVFGTVSSSVDNNKFYEDGASAEITLTATPSSTLKYLKWKLNGEPYGEGASEQLRTLTWSGNITESLHFNAIFTDKGLYTDQTGWKISSNSGRNSNYDRKDITQLLLTDSKVQSWHSYWRYPNNRDGGIYIIIDMAETKYVGAVRYIQGGDIPGNNGDTKNHYGDAIGLRIDVYVTDNLGNGKDEKPLGLDSNDQAEQFPVVHSSEDAPKAWGTPVASVTGANLPQVEDPAGQKILTAAKAGRYVIVYFERNDWFELQRLWVYDATESTYEDRWLGAESNDWTDTDNWDNEVPSELSKVIIPADVEYYPVASEGATAASITLEAGAELGRQDLLTANTVNISYDLSNNSDRFWGITVPVEGVTANDFLQQDKSAETTVWKYTGVPPSGSGSAYTELTSGASLSHGLGYLVWLYEDTYDGKFNISGSLPEEYSAISFDFNNGTNASHFGFIGNPLLSTIDFDALYLYGQGSNSTLIRNNYTVVVNTESGPDYATYAGGTNGGYAGPVNEAFTEYIAPLQGFFVEKAESEEGSETPATEPTNWGSQLTYSVEAISALSPETRPVLKAPAAVTDKITITATAGENGYITFISRRANGSQIFGNADATKMLGSTSILPTIYTLKPTANGDVAAVAGNIINDEESLIPVVLKTTYSGTISLKLEGMDAFDAFVTFIDNETDESIDITGMSEYEYPFTYAGSSKATTDRFAIRISKSATAISTLGDAAISVYSADNTIFASAASKIDRIEVFNIAGNLVYSEKPATTSRTITLSAPAGVYSVRVATADGLKTVKVIVK